MITAIEKLLKSNQVDIGKSRITQDVPEYLKGTRRSGRTTRLVDCAIQELFTKREFFIHTRLLEEFEELDHFENVRRICDMIIRRLSIEHPGVRFHFQNLYFKLI